MFIEQWPLLDSLYMTVITIASVGFMEVHPLTGQGRIFTIVLILGGTGVLVYGVSTIIAFIVEGELTDALRRRKMQKKIAAMKGHFIVCGVGQTGKHALEEMVRTRKDVVAIERDPATIRQLDEQEICYVQGDATHNTVLQAAGIERARGIVSALQSDAENLLVVFTTKRLNPDIRVISKAVEEESEQKIRMAGADSVVMPNYIGGLRMASELIRPSVVSFLDLMLRSQEKTIRVDELAIDDQSPYKDKTLQATGILSKTDVTVVALSRRSGKSYEFNPPENAVLKPGDVVILMGDINAINGIKGAVS
ncbi:MAG: potassium channel protein [Nitrospirae bacterium]|nr:potassium channel protein [Nitrospirota bacterium]